MDRKPVTIQGIALSVVPLASSIFCSSGEYASGDSSASSIFRVYASGVSSAPGVFRFSWIYVLPGILQLIQVAEALSSLARRCLLLLLVLVLQFHMLVDMMHGHSVLRRILPLTVF